MATIYITPTYQDYIEEYETHVAGTGQELGK
jgi:hypothetical protein